jgi:sporulation protein YlmC with PRC-barrel domain
VGTAHYNTKFGRPTELDIDDEELKRAVVPGGQDFDWGDRTKERSCIAITKRRPTGALSIPNGFEASAFQVFRQNHGTLVEVTGSLTAFRTGSERTHMLVRYVIAGLAASAMLASVAFAQSPSATTDRATTAAPAAASDTSSFKGTWRTSKLVGLNVYNDSNESLGSINDLLADKNGDIKGVVIGVGGFLGVGEHLVAVPFDKIKFVNEPSLTPPGGRAGWRQA